MTFATGTIGLGRRPIVSPASVTAASSRLARNAGRDDGDPTTGSDIGRAPGCCLVSPGRTSRFRQQGGLLLVREGVQATHVGGALVVPADAAHRVEPVVLAEHLAETRRVAVQHLGVDLLGLEAAQDPAVVV